MTPEEADADSGGRGNLAAGHEPVLIVPGACPADELTDHGRVITLPGVLLPGAGGYRVLPGRRRIVRLLDDLAPERLEVSDRTLRWTGRWARSRGVRSMMVSHESLTGLLDVWGVPAGTGTRVADALNARTAADYDVVACTTAWATEEFRRLGVPNLTRVTLGVDLETFSPHRYDPAVRARYAAPDEVVVNAHSALSEVLGGTGAAGVAATGSGDAFASGVRRLLSIPERTRRTAARARACRYG